MDLERRRKFNEDLRFSFPLISFPFSVMDGSASGGGERPWTRGLEVAVAMVVGASRLLSGEGHGVVLLNKPRLGVLSDKDMNSK